MHAYVFSTDLLFRELHLNERTDSGEDLPPWPPLHPPVLLNVLLDAADRQVLDLKGNRDRFIEGVEVKQFQTLQHVELNDTNVISEF